MVFRTEGTAWDGQKWVLAPCLVTYAEQVEAIRPGTFPTDGTVASETHDANSPNSDHTVWPKSGSGVVYAIDIAESGGISIDDLFEAERLARDPRGKYWIHNRKMFSSYPAHGIPAWTWRPYSGYNAHLSHGHKSVHHTASLANNKKPWDIGDHSPIEGDEMFLPLAYGMGYKKAPADSGFAGQDMSYRQQDIILLQNYLHRVGAPYDNLDDNADNNIDGVYGKFTVAQVKTYIGGDGTGVSGWGWDNLVMNASALMARSEIKKALDLLKPGGLTEAEVKQLINSSSVVAP